MWWRSLIALLAVCCRLQGQTEPTPVTDHVYPRAYASSSPPLLPTSTTSPSDNTTDGLYTLVTVASVAALSVLCACVLVTVVIVMVVRIKRGWRRWRHSRRCSNSASSRPSSNGVTLHLLSSTVSSTQQFEWYRPRSLTPATPSPPPPLPTSPTPLPPHTPLPSSHDYSEIGTPSPHPFQRVHLYEEIMDHSLLSGAEVCDGVDGGGRERVHQYSLLEYPSQQTTSSPVQSTPPSPSGHRQSGNSVSQRDNRDSIRDSSSLSEEESISILDSSPNWIISPASRLRPHKDPEQKRPSRRVVPYRVSLILPLWEGRDRGPCLHQPSLGHSVNSMSCHALQHSGRYNHLEGVTGYGSLEGKGLYATLEPFMSIEPMRPRSRSCDARLYNHLKH